MLCKVLSGMTVTLSRLEKRKSEPKYSVQDIKGCFTSAALEISFLLSVGKLSLKTIELVFWVQKRALQGPADKTFCLSAVVEETHAEEHNNDESCFSIHMQKVQKEEDKCRRMGAILKEKDRSQERNVKE